MSTTVNQASRKRDTGVIANLVQRARTRLRIQGAMEGATTALILASVTALAVVFAVRTELVSESTGLVLLLGCVALVVLGAIVGSIRRLDDEMVARRVDRASDLADRLSNAIAFDRILSSSPASANPASANPASANPASANNDELNRDFMNAAIADAVLAAPRANVVAATPYRLPRDARAAAGFLAVSALVAGLAIPTPDRSAALLEATPSYAAPGAIVNLRGRNLLRGISADAAGEPSLAVPANVSVFLGESGGLPVKILAWSVEEARIEVPTNAAYGDTAIMAFIGSRKLGPIPFTVIDPKDQRYHTDDSVAMTDDDLAYARSLLDDLRDNAKTNDVAELNDYVAKIEQLLDQAERGEITKEQLLEEMQKAEEAMNAGVEPKPEEINKDLADTGKELQKEDLTKELGAAMAKGDLQKAEEELQKLAEKLDKGELTKEQQEKLAKAMEMAAKQFDKKQEEQQAKDEQQKQKLEKEKLQLEKQKAEAKTDEEKEKLGLQLDKKKDELKRLEKEKEQKSQSAQRSALKRLHKDMEKAAESLSQKSEDPQDQQTDAEKQKQASKSMKDAAQETGKVDRDQRKTATQKKVASQMEDLKEAMRRAKQRGAKGAKDPFGQKGKQQDFAQRAKGGKGKGSAWKPGGQGKGQGQGKGPGENGGDGTGDPQAGNNWGTGHDDNLTGDATATGGHTSDQVVEGIHGKGPSKRETILSAAQKGFASRGYKDVYTEYKKQVEEVMHGEKVPASYKYYVKRYFTKIKPHSMD